MAMGQYCKPNRSEHTIRNGLVNASEFESIECETGIVCPPKPSHEMVRPRNVELQSPPHPNPKAR